VVKKRRDQLLVFFQRLNRDLGERFPGYVPETKVVKRSADLHHGVAYMIGAKADVVLENTTALDRADDVLNPHIALGDDAIIGFLLIG
jgi:hypothetical protein